LASTHLFGSVHPVKLENMLRRVHSNSANLVHGRSPLFEINTDLTLAHPMPPGAVHTNNTDAGGEVSNPTNKPLSASIGEAGDLIEGRLVEAPSM